MSLLIAACPRTDLSQGSLGAFFPMSACRLIRCYRVRACPRGQVPGNEETRYVADNFGKDHLRVCSLTPGTQANSSTRRLYGCTWEPIRAVAGRAPQWRCRYGRAWCTRETRGARRTALSVRRSGRHVCHLTGQGASSDDVCGSCSSATSALTITHRDLPSTSEATEVILMPASSSRLLSRRASRVRSHTTSVR